MVTERLSEVAHDVARQTGVFIYDIEYRNKKLIIYIDSENGVGINDCERFSNEISKILDVENLIQESYTLEVSSPGVFRRLRKPEHFSRYIGAVCMLKRKGNEKTLCKIVDASGETIKFEINGSVVELKIDEIESCSLKPELKL